MACSSTPVGCWGGPLTIGLLDSLLLPGTCQLYPDDPQTGASVSNHNESSLAGASLEKGEPRRGSFPLCLPCPALAALLPRVYTSQRPSLPSSSVCLDFPGETSDTPAGLAPLSYSKPP